MKKLFKWLTTDPYSSSPDVRAMSFLLGAMMLLSGMIFVLPGIMAFLPKFADRRWDLGVPSLLIGTPMLFVGVVFFMRGLGGEFFTKVGFVKKALEFISLREHRIAVNPFLSLVFVAAVIVVIYVIAMIRRALM